MSKDKMPDKAPAGAVNLGVTNDGMVTLQTGSPVTVFTAEQARSIGCGLIEYAAVAEARRNEQLTKQPGSRRKQ